MVLAGLRRSTGLVVAYEMSDLKNYIRRYLNWGEYLFDKLAQMAEKSYYFRKETALDGFLDSIFKRYQKFSKSHGDFTRLEAVSYTHLDVYKRQI